jgi:catechol 2,3-dioxygenase-like lactoylglutathione lyase family enzyme
MRFQLALNVKNLEEAVAYYSKLFGADVNKRKPGYANFAIEKPPLKLVLFEAPDAPERLNHVGFECFDNDEVEAVIREIEPEGIVDRIDRDETCCYAKKSTLWTSDPQGLRWEFYLVREDSETFGAAPAEAAPRAAAAPAEGEAAVAPAPGEQADREAGAAPAAGERAGAACGCAA